MTIFTNYANKLTDILKNYEWDQVKNLADDILHAWKTKNQVFICGNGGSAGNAIHLVNDFIYGVSKTSGKGIRAISLAANPSVITCLANDIGYDNIFSEQLLVQAQHGDVLIALSGSGNSKNIVNALTAASRIGMKSYAILGYDGGECKKISNNVIHFDVHDMQVSEDLQLIVGHMVMQYLHNQYLLNKHN